MRDADIKERLVNEKIANWEKTSQIGRLKILRTSYIWLVIVPVFARAIENAPNPLPLPAISPDFELPLELPFTWQLFYFSAVLIAIASAIYSIFCPELITKFENFSAYRAEGRGENYLLFYEERNGVFCLPPLKDVLDPDASTNPDERLQNAFWHLHEYEKARRSHLSTFCYSLYVTGLLAFAFVMVQNVYYVVKISL